MICHHFFTTNTREIVCLRWMRALQSTTPSIFVHNLYYTQHIPVISESYAVSAIPGCVIRNSSAFCLRNDKQKTFYRRRLLSEKLVNSIFTAHPIYTLLQLVIAWDNATFDLTKTSVTYITLAKPRSIRITRLAKLYFRNVADTQPKRSFWIQISNLCF